MPHLEERQEEERLKEWPSLPGGHRPTNVRPDPSDVRYVIIIRDRDGDTLLETYVDTWAQVRRSTKSLGMATSDVADIIVEDLQTGDLWTLNQAKKLVKKKN
jgi:hypothetical protein